ncbi:MAG TPA: histidine phosphatase family protein [Jatrophihabitantaceae bacterium]|nr:histidine phosphatase family protein [Jatrophihabitantaceae bacterium]
MELLLVRHGESTANVAREAALAAGAEVIAVEQRDPDVPLSQLGAAQADALGRWLAGPGAAWRPDAVWSSPYVRARQTAEVTLGAAGLNIPIRIDERLRDKELGILDTLTWQGVQQRYPLEADRRRWLGKFYYRAPGGEAWTDVALRVRSVLADIQQIDADRRVLVVVHDAVVMLFRYVCEGMTEEQILTVARATSITNGAITRLVRDATGRWACTDFNVDQHLVNEAGDLRTEHPGERPAVRG